MNCDLCDVNDVCNFFNCHYGYPNEITFARFEEIFNLRWQQLKNCNKFNDLRKSKFEEANFESILRDILYDWYGELYLSNVRVDKQFKHDFLSSLLGTDKLNDMIQSLENDKRMDDVKI